MRGFSRPEQRRLLLALIPVLAAAFPAQAEVWRLTPGTSVCPVQRLDTEALVPDSDGLPEWGPVQITPPATETGPTIMKDPPTRAGFAGPDLFVCCHQGAADYETCEVTNLDSGRTNTEALESDVEPPWLERLDERAAWPFPHLTVVWTEAFPGDREPSTVFRATLRHDPSGVTADLGTVLVPVVGALKLWAVRVSPDGARFALIRHVYFGENTDVYPVTIYASAGPPRAVYAEAVQVMAGNADEAARMARLLSPSAPRPDK